MRKKPAFLPANAKMLSYAAPLQDSNQRRTALDRIMPSDNFGQAGRFVLLAAIPGAAAVLSVAACGQSALGNASPRNLEMLRSGAGAIVVASPAANSADLMRTDGLPGGAVTLGRFQANDERAGPAYLTLTSAGSVYFAACGDAQTGTELWRSDLTPNGAVLVADVAVGAASSAPRDLVELPSGSLVFSAHTAGSGRELWITGADGTELLADISVGAESSDPRDFVLIGSELMFTADDGVHGRELWVTDGTEQGTRMLADLRAGGAGAVPLGLCHHLGQVWFSADDGMHGHELWRSDGTPAGTSMVADICPGSRSSQPGSFAAVAGALFFAAHDGAGPARLFRSDGTAAGTLPVGAAGAPTSPSQLTVNGGRLWFVAETPIAGPELWSTLGLPSSTAILHDICPGPNGSFPDQIVAFGSSEVLFVASDGFRGRELWRASPASSSLVRDLWPGPLGGRITGLRVESGLALFAAQSDDGAGHELYRTDGSAAGTQRLEDLNPVPEQLTMQIGHSVDTNGGRSLQILAPAGKATFVLVSMRPGPAIDLNAFGIPSYGLLELDLGRLIFAIGLFAANTASEISFGMPANLEVRWAMQGFTLNPVELSGVTGIAEGDWDLSGCAPCAAASLTALTAM